MPRLKLFFDYLRHCLLGVSLCFVATTCFSQNETPEFWFNSGQAELKKALAQQPNTNRAKNIILLIGDGMGVSTVTAGRIFDGQDHGHSGEENLLAFEKLPYLGLSKTYNTNQQTPDSAGTMSAMMTGIKTKAGFISINQNVKRGDCLGTATNYLSTFLEQAESVGLATGIVTTARLTHATPAATYAHVTERDWEGDSDMPMDAKQQGCKDIASQLIDFKYGDGIEVAMGGGRRYFLPATIEGGRRQDERDLTKEWTQHFSKANYVSTREQLNSIDAEQTQHLLGLFNNSHMRFYQDRLAAEASEPNLMEMTSKALDILEKNSKGYFLMVEAGRIDHGHHFGNAFRALKDTQEFSLTVQAILDRVNLNDTLVIVTADHSHTLTISGYPTRGNPILGLMVANDNKGDSTGKPFIADDGKPFTTLGYRNGPGDFEKDKPIGARSDLSTVDTTTPDYNQQVLVPLEDESHGGEDVAIYAAGPWAHLFQHTHEQNYIYHVMAHAAQLSKR